MENTNVNRLIIFTTFFVLLAVISIYDATHNYMINNMVGSSTKLEPPSISNVQKSTVSYDDMIKPVVFSVSFDGPPIPIGTTMYSDRTYQLSLLHSSVIINSDKLISDIRAKIDQFNSILYENIYQQYYTSIREPIYNKYNSIRLMRSSYDALSKFPLDTNFYNKDIMFGESDIKTIKKILVNNDWLTTENANIGMTKENLKNIGNMICPLNINNLEKLGIRIIVPSSIRTQYDVIMIPPGKMMKVYETNNTKDHKVYHSGVYNGNIIKKGRMLWLGFIERQHDIPDNIEI